MEASPGQGTRPTIVAVAVLAGLALAGAACSSDAGAAGSYSHEGSSSDVLELHDDGTFCLLEEGFEASGTWTVGDSTVSLTAETVTAGTGTVDVPPDQATEEGTLEGDTIVDPDGVEWVRTDDPPADCGEGRPTDATRATGAEPTTEPTDGASPASSTERYENAEHGFAVDYPSSWGLDKSPAGKPLAQFFALESLDDQLPANVNVTFEELPLDFTPRQYMDIGLEQLKRLTSDFEQVGRAELEVGGMPGASLEYIGRFEGAPSSGHFYQVAVLDERRAFVFTYAGGEDNFDTYRADAESIINSLELT